METQKTYINILSESIKSKQLHEKRIFSLRSVAARVNLSHSMLSQILSGKKKPGVVLLQRLCDELEVPSDLKSAAIESLIKSSNRMKKYFPVDVPISEEVSAPIESDVKVITVTE